MHSNIEQQSIYQREEGGTFSYSSYLSNVNAQ
jgi:hypothetical protein